MTIVVLQKGQVYNQGMNELYSMHLKITKIENGQFLAESEDIPGLVAQGRTIAETVEIAQELKKTFDSYIEHKIPFLLLLFLFQMKLIQCSVELTTTIPNHPGT